MGPEESSPSVSPDDERGAAAVQPGSGGDSPGKSAAGPAPQTAARREDRGNMLPRRGKRRFGIERLLVRLIATCGIIGIGVALGAILGASKVQGWITGLVIAAVSVILAGLLWSSRSL
jgi:hypothetical protein